MGVNTFHDGTYEMTFPCDEAETADDTDDDCEDDEAASSRTSITASAYVTAFGFPSGKIRTVTVPGTSTTTRCVHCHLAPAAVILEGSCD